MPKQTKVTLTEEYLKEMLASAERRGYRLGKAAAVKRAAMSNAERQRRFRARQASRKK